MLSKRIIPCLDVNKGKVVKGVKFQKLSIVGDPVELAASYYRDGADELIFLDIGASPNNRQTLFKIVKKVSKKVFIPLTVGGGITSVDDVKKALFSGADKVAINTAAVKKPFLIEKSAKKFGKQCIVCAVDAKKTDDSWNVLINGGRKTTDLDAVEWVKKAEKLGAGEILLTSWDADGTKKGYDLELTKKIVNSVNIPVIASGGAGSLKDILNVLRKGDADAALIASLFHYKKYKVREVKKYLKKQGVKVRWTK